MATSSNMTNRVCLRPAPASRAAQRTPGLLLPVLLVLVALSAPLRVAWAQVEPVEPRWMTVTRQTPMRCGELTTFYKVADLEAGDVLRVDGLSTRWARVLYPEGQHAFVAIADVKDVTGQTLTLKPSARIRAPNAISGLSGSWRSLYLGDVKPDTRLSVMGTAEARDGQVIGYRVEPPGPPAVEHPAYGYVELSALRDATAAEVQAHLESLRSAQAETAAPETSQPPADQPEPNQTETIQPTPSQPQPTAPEPETSPQTPAELTRPEPRSPTDPGAGERPPASADPAATTRPDPAPAITPAAEPVEPDMSLLEPMVPPGSEPPAPAADTSEDAGETAEPDQAAGQADQPAPTEGQPAPAAEKSHLSWEELESTLTRVRRQGGVVLDEALEELIAEYERTRASTDSAAVRQAIDSRVEWLRLRKTARDQRLALDATLEEAARLRNTVTDRRREWESTRAYDIVGRLVPSAVYDGQRLPRMYRVQAVGASGLTRTIGYLRDVPELNLDALLGQVVGVTGQANLDNALQLRVITPRSVVRLRPADAAGG